jgi:hypothetical protein
MEINHDNRYNDMEGSLRDMGVYKSLTYSSAGVLNKISKQMKWPNRTPKSVSNVAIFGFSSTCMAGSKNRLNFRYLCVGLE